MAEKPTYEELLNRISVLEKTNDMSASDDLGVEPDWLGISHPESLFHKAAVPLCLINKKTSLLYFNNQFEKTFGYSQEEIPTLEQWWLKAYPDPVYRNEVIDICVAELKRAVDNNTDIKPIEYNVTCKNGDMLTMVVYGSFVGDDDDMLLTFFDVTERKQAEEKLKASEKRLATFFKNNPAAVAIARLSDSRLEDVNNTWQEITGYSSAEAIGHTPRELNLWVNPEEREHLIEMAQKPGRARNEIQLRHRSGEIHSLLMSAEIIELKGQDYLLTMAQDITEHNKAQRALRESQQKYHSMVDNIGIGVVLLNPEMTVIEVNRQIRQWFPAIDFGKRPICYQAFRDPQQDSPCDKCPTEKTLRDGKVHESTMTLPMADGAVSTRSVRVIASPVFDDKGQVNGVIEIIEDITARLKLENQLRQSQKLESVGTLAGGIAHDFNNILSAIIGFTELAMDDAPKSSLLMENLQEAFKAGMRAKELVQQILIFARQSDDEHKPIQVDIIAKEVMKLIRSTTPTTIEIKNSERSKSLIMGNPTQVHQIFLNLCTNAVHAMEKSGGTLTVDLLDVHIDKNSSQAQLGLDPGDYIKIVVSDTGPGIPPAIIDAIFEPYFTTKQVGEGTGMGLSVVHGIVESYGGRITVDSTQDIGTVFSIYLPVCKKREESLSQITEPTPMGSERILLVDDEAPIVKLTAKILDGLGYSVATRTSSVEALALFRSKPNDFDAVVTDMTMPNLPGDKLAIELLKIRPDIPIVLCTGYSKQISHENALQLGIKAFVFKPIAKANLAQTLRKVLDEAKGPTRA